MKSAIRRLYEASVFVPVSVRKIPTSEKVLVALFHRSAATLYFIYMLWAIVAASVSGNLLGLGWGDLFEEFFTFLVIPIAALSCIGATFFPRTGRLELFSASAFVALIVVYLLFMLLMVFMHGYGQVDDFIISLSYLVIPSARVMFVYRELMYVAGSRR